MDPLCNLFPNESYCHSEADPGPELRGGGPFFACYRGSFYPNTGVDPAVPSPGSTTAITHTNNTDTKAFMAVQKSILEMAVHV